MTVTDINGNGATATGQYPNNKCHEARYNGSVGWAHLVSNVTAPAYSSNIGIERRPTTGWETITDTLTSIEVEYKFRLTASDFASGTSRFEVVPEPATLVVLLLMGALALLGRRR